METAPIQPGQMQGIVMQGAGAVSTDKMAPDTKRRLYYGIAAVVLISLSGALGRFVPASPVSMYVSFCVAFTLLGVLHLFLIDWLKLFGSDRTFSARLLYSLVVVLLSTMGYFAAFYFLSHKSGYSFYFALSLWYIMVPMAVMRCFDLALAVPARDYKTWLYPSKPIVADMDRIDPSNFAIITFIFPKKYGDNNKANLQSKAPYDYKLGDLFYGFINEWNRRNPQDTIDYLDIDGQVFGWHFYVQDKWYQSPHYLDPDLTIRDNNIKVNQIIQTVRIPQEKPDTIA